MPAVPGITLNYTLLDYKGDPIGSAAQPAYLRIALCGFRGVLPRISGTALLAPIHTWPTDIPYLGVAGQVKLWGNDAITPAGTYYQISVLDAKKNVIQTACYQFSGSGNPDLSTLTPFAFPTIVPVSPTITAGSVIVAYSATPVFDAALITAGVIDFEITLTGDVTSSTVSNVSPGQIVTFMVIQDGVGGHAFAWPGTCLNTTPVSALAGSVTVQMFQVRSNGYLYPVGPATYN